jgi:23S rRNA (cytidine1920-2'-O)/16S rRNA (cytidine1409-2'-O)-methyltransferase
MAAGNPKKRLDILLTERNLAPTRLRSRHLILSGKVLVNKIPVFKSGRMVSAIDDIRIKDEDIPYVSRGGLKLSHALAHFNIDVSHLVCLDVGASTGGFTDCLLQAGASHVFAVDVGYGQLAWKLRTDSRVTVIERANIRYLEPDALACPVDLAVIDASFISLKIVVPAAMKFMKTPSRVLALIKPQFEVGKGKVGKGGIVRDPALKVEVIEELLRFFVRMGLHPEGVIPSPISGAKGNEEFMISLKQDV